MKIKTLIGHETESSEIVKRLLVLTAASQNEQQQWIKLPAAFSIKEIPVESCEIATSGKLQKWKYAEKIFGEINNNKNIKVEVLIGANCLEALNPLEVIPSQDKGTYTFRTDLGCCVVGLIKAQQLDVISGNRIGVMKAGTQDTAEYHFELRKNVKILV